MAGEWTIELVEHTSPLLQQAVELRYRVLHEPFGVMRDDEWYDDDPASTHAVALDGDGRVVGYARLIAEEGGASGQIRQVAVEAAWERRGMGSSLIEALLDRARGLGMTDVWLNARLTAVPFYEKLGFRVTSGVFRTAKTYLPHVRMDREL